MISKSAWLTIAALLAAGTAAQADSSARFTSWSGTEVSLASGEFADILKTSGTAFSAADMNEVNTALQADGIQTQGYLSIFVANTAAGLSIVTMMDGVESATPTGEATIVSATSFVPSTATWQYNLDAGGSFDSFAIGDQVVLNGLFEWNSGIESEAFAISNLQMDDMGSITLNNILPGGLSPNQTIQLLTSNGGEWSVADTFDFAFALATQSRPKGRPRSPQSAGKRQRTDFG